MTTRTATIWIPDWPLVVALAVNGLPASTPAVVVTNKRIRVASGYARHAGIRTNMPLRQAQELLPELHILQSNETLETKEFEYIAQLTETLIPHIDILRPGLLTFGATGPTRYFKGEDALADKIVNLLAEEAQIEAHVGFAEGLLAAVLSARNMQSVPVGRSVDFLAERPLSEAQYAMATKTQRTRVRELVALWDRLGIRSFGQLAQLPRTNVHTRFGEDGARIYDLAQGKDLYSAEDQRSRPEVIVETTLETPATRVDEAAFYARRLAAQVHTELISQSATCGRIQVSARMSDGTELHRSWRTDDTALGAMSPERLTQRVRWQLEGWLTNSALRERARLAKQHQTAVSAQKGEHVSAEQLERAQHDVEEQLAEQPSEELVWLQLTALDVVGAATHQESLWGGSAGVDVRAHRAAERVAALIGPQHVHAIQAKGGRTYQERFRLVPWDDEDAAAGMTAQTATISRGNAADSSSGMRSHTESALSDVLGTSYPDYPREEPWPGQLPSPSPTLLLQPPEAIALLDHNGAPIKFNNRLTMSGTPMTLAWTDESITYNGALRRRPDLTILDWAGPWPVTTGWWRSQRQRAIYLQLVPKEHQALLVYYQSGAWHCEGIYD